MQFNSWIFPALLRGLSTPSTSLLGAREVSGCRTRWLLGRRGYLFYGYWDLALPRDCSRSRPVIDYRHRGGGSKASRRRGASASASLTLSVAVNLGILGFFKYFGFFVDSTRPAARGDRSDSMRTFQTLEILLPVGISFYTFQTLSYTIDVYRRRMPATHDVLGVRPVRQSFFPQLVAGTHRASLAQLLPQILCAAGRDRFQRVQAGLWLDCLGLLQEDRHRGPSRPRGEPDVRRKLAGRLGGLEPLVARSRIHNPHLLRLLGLLGHRTRPLAKLHRASSSC